jgi:hypothetical protein
MANDQIILTGEWIYSLAPAFMPGKMNRSFSFGVLTPA